LRHHSGGKGKASVTDSDRTGSTPVAPVTSPAGGGSVMSGDLVTEAAFLTPSKQVYVPSPFGQSYPAHLEGRRFRGDTGLHLVCMAMSWKGYQDYGSVTRTDLSSSTLLENVLAAWYGNVRDLGKRSLKYKHLPITLHDTSMLRYILDIYTTNVSNCVMLMNLNRTPLVNAALSRVSAYLGKYMSRINRAYRRMGALLMPSFVKAHAVRNGLIISDNYRMAPLIRFWLNTFWLPSSTGGPVWISGADTLFTGLTTDAILANMVTNIEAATLWLETGVTTGTAMTSDQMDDFNAVKDAIDMTFDVVPGSWVEGLPDPKGMPGITWIDNIYNDMMCRAYTIKDITGGTDVWIAGPTGDMASPFGPGFMPIIGNGPRDLYDFTVLGTPKCVLWNDSGQVAYEDVNSAVRVLGTDFWLRDYLNGASTEIRNIFGLASGAGYREEYVSNQTTDNPVQVNDAINWSTDASVRDFQIQDSLRSRHVMSYLSWSNQKHAGGTLSFMWEKLMEGRFERIHYAPWTDLGLNTEQFVMTALGIPYANRVASAT